MTCEECRFFDAGVIEDDARMFRESGEVEEVGECRINPPVRYLLGTGGFVSAFPVVLSKYDWCGQFQPKEAAK